MIQQVEGDTGTTVNQKTVVINNLKESKRKFELKLLINGEDVSEEIASDTFVNAFSYVCTKVGYERIDMDEQYLSKNKQELIEKYPFAVNSIKEFDGYYLFTCLSNHRKLDVINGLITRYGLTEITCTIQQVL